MHHRMRKHFLASGKELQLDVSILSFSKKEKGQEKTSHFLKKHRCGPKTADVEVGISRLRDRASCAHEASSTRFPSHTPLFSSLLQHSLPPQ